MGPMQNKLKEKVTTNDKLVFNILNGKMRVEICFTQHKEFHSNE
jgi:hypothetical protein